MIEELNILLLEYSKLYPESESPMGLWVTYGEEELVNILKKANGREIIMIVGEGVGNIEYKYE